MTEETKIPPKHPRAESLRIREKLIKHFKSGVVAQAGLIAHGRGEAFDYLLGEKTTENARRAFKAVAATMLLAKKPVISVNGNVAALAAEDINKLADVFNAKVEVNLFYRSREREIAIKKVLDEAGVKEVLGIDEKMSAQVSELHSERRRVDKRGILVADVVFVPLEDGDRTEALRKMGKTVIAIDLNPLSRTAQLASITIVDNIIRVIPDLIKEGRKLKTEKLKKLQKIVSDFDNRKNLSNAIKLINKRLLELSEKGVYITQVLQKRRDIR
ncbi:phosphopantothenate/pantothenate synthetase [Candidatus Bathyarchaeota archaeon]|nr:phosphopantothenate/pantothenate synthetase [Candidatus Bathyarchaeota archaeon]